MPTKLQKKGHKTKNITVKSLHCRHVKIVLLRSDIKKCASKEYFEGHKEQRLVYHSKYHGACKDDRIAEYYDVHKEERKASFSDHYDYHKEERKACLSKYYTTNKEK